METTVTTRWFTVFDGFAKASCETMSINSGPPAHISRTAAENFMSAGMRKSDHNLFVEI